MKFSALQIFKRTFPRIAFFSYVIELRRQLVDCITCLDVGCGSGSPVKFLDFEHSVGVDGYALSLKAAKTEGTHSEYLLSRVQDIEKHFHAKQFDCVLALDVIEHLTKEEGYKLISDMEKIASKKMVIFTPNGFLPQDNHNGDLQLHLSGWDAAEMKRLGFRVIGMHGFKFLRGEQHQHLIRPKALGGVISELTHYLCTRWYPEKSAAILCIKTIDASD